MAITQSEIDAIKTLKLSEHFSLFELIWSSHYPNLVEMPNNIVFNDLKKFAVNNLEEIRGVCFENTAVTINSGYRNAMLNAKVGGVMSSIHQVYVPPNNVFRGCAADVSSTHINIFKIFKKTMDLKSDIKTVILYPKQNFIHVDTDVLKSERVWMVSMDSGNYAYVPIKMIGKIESWLKNKYKFEVKIWD